MDELEPAMPSAAAGAERHAMLIDGEERFSSSGETFALVDPATGEPWSEVSAAGEREVEAAVAAADRAFRGAWRTIKPRERARILSRIAAGIRDAHEELARTESRNVGKPIREAREEVTLAADCFDYYAGAIDKIGGATIPVSAPGVSLTFREAIGVCALIVPWNFPLAITAWKVAPALAMGNSVVVKPATPTPLTALRLAKIARDAGLPPGVLNVVTGSGSAIGEMLVRHPLVRKIAFTGSTEVGRRVMELAAREIKRVTLELGGKSANVIFADADLERAIPAAVSSVLANGGQDCCARSRILIEEPIHDRVVEELRARFEARKVGPPLEESTEMGPLVSAAHRERVEAYLEAGRSEGATLVCGGERPAERGAYLRPALFAEVGPEMRIAREEIFGPVAAAIRFRGEEEAVRIANDSVYGLSGSVWTRDGARAIRVARAIETGVVSVNSGWSVHLEAPFGGRKESGTGRELGLAALDHYSELKSIFIQTDE